MDDMFALDVGYSEKTKPIALDIEAYYIGHRSLLLFLHSKTPASTHLTEEPKIFSQLETLVTVKNNLVQFVDRIYLSF